MKPWRVRAAGRGVGAYEEVAALAGVGDALAAHDRDARADGHHDVGVVHREPPLVHGGEGDELGVAQRLHPPARRILKPLW